MTTNATTAEDRLAKLGRIRQRLLVRLRPGPHRISDHYALKCHQPGTKNQAGQFPSRLRAGCQERSRKNRRQAKRHANPIVPRSNARHSTPGWSSSRRLGGRTVEKVELSTDSDFPCVSIRFQDNTDLTVIIDPWLTFQADYSR